MTQTSGRRSAQRPAAWLLLLLRLLASPAPSHGTDPGQFYMDPAFAKPDYSLYHTKEQVFEEISTITKANPDIMRVDNVEQPLNKTEARPYTVPVQVITVEPGGLTRDWSRKLRLLLNYGEHGRELITVEVALALLRALADPRGELARSEARGHGAERLRTLLHTTVFKIIPMENTSGRDMVERGALCERKNGRGVDTNRNWGVHWGHKEKDYDPAEEYPGTHPFSEPEAASILQVAEDFKPHVWMNAHSGMEALFMPYDHLPHVPAGDGAQASLRLLERLNHISCGGRCAVGCGGKSVGYLAHGTATDYMYDRLRVPLAFTWEIYGDAKAHYNDCFRMFNPVTQALYEEVVANWTTAVMALVELMPSHPQIPPPRVQPAGRKMDAGAADVLIDDHVRKGPPAQEHGPRLTDVTAYPKAAGAAWGWGALERRGGSLLGLGLLGVCGAGVGLLLLRRGAGGAVSPRWGAALGLGQRAFGRRTKGSESVV